MIERGEKTSTFYLGQVKERREKEEKTERGSQEIWQE